MAKQVTVEGSLTPCAELPRGHRRTVTWTPRVQRMIDRGYFVLIGEVWPEGDNPVLTAHTGISDVEYAEKMASLTREMETPAPVADTDQAVADDQVREAVGSDPSTVAAAPANNATREKWAAFLASQGIPVPEDAARDGLVHIWQQASGGS